MYKCDYCNKEFPKSFNLTRHIEKVHLKPFKCGVCRAKFKTEHEKQEHEKTKHHPLYCNECNYETISEKFLKKHYETKHNQKRKHEANEEIPNKRIKHNAEISL